MISVIPIVKSARAPSHTKLGLDGFASYEHHLHMQWAYPKIYARSGEKRIGKTSSEKWPFARPL